METAAVLKNEILVFSLDGESSDHSFVRLAEEIDSEIEVERVLFDDTGVDRGREVVEFHLRCSVEISHQLQTRERAVLLALILSITDTADTGDAIRFVRQSQLF